MMVEDIGFPGSFFLLEWIAKADDLEMQAQEIYEFM